MAQTWEDRATSALDAAESQIGDCNGFEWVLVYHVAAAITCALLSIAHTISASSNRGDRE